MTVMYIEDDIETLESMKGLFEIKFDNIYAYNSPLKAFDEFKKNKDSIDVVVTDLNMGEISGLELIKMIREIDKKIPILITSAHNEHQYLIEAIKLKVDGYMLKPINVPELLEELDKVIEILEIKNSNKTTKNILQQYKKAIDSSAIVSKTDIDGIITYVNDAFCEITGYKRDELIGKNHNIIRHEDNPDSVYKVLWNTISNKKIWKGILKNKKKDGSAYFVDSTIMPIVNSAGEIEEYIGMRHDITQLELYKQDIEKELNSANIELIETQKEIVQVIGTIAEAKSKETGLHVKRVAKYSYMIAKLYGLSEEEATLIKQASPLHDIGKVAIPEDILHKPGKLTDEEFAYMKKHAEFGYEMLKDSNRDILKVAATIAHQHHEKWDGSGYPNALVGDDIHIHGRITAIADVFDALGHDRVYKKAWPIDDVFDFIKNGSGTHFDPTLVDIFLDHKEQFLSIKEQIDSGLL
jgi:PAS domain S-box-containing protein